MNPGSPGLGLGRAAADHFELLEEAKAKVASPARLLAEEVKETQSGHR